MRVVRRLSSYSSSIKKGGARVCVAVAVCAPVSLYGAGSKHGAFGNPVSCWYNTSCDAEHDGSDQACGYGGRMGCDLPVWCWTSPGCGTPFSCSSSRSGKEDISESHNSTRGVWWQMDGVCRAASTHLIEVDPVPVDFLDVSSRQSWPASACPRGRWLKVLGDFPVCMEDRSPWISFLTGLSECVRALCDVRALRRKVTSKSCIGRMPIVKSRGLRY